MSNLANEMRPMNFDDYVSQKGATNYIKSVIKSNQHPAGIIITGLPGTGKTTLANLYARATLCERRAEGEYNPCGECDSCKKELGKDSHPNVTLYRITEASVFKEAVSDLISISKQAPALTHDNIREDNHRRIIIIDELQNATRQSISPFLDSLEFAHDKVTIVLISMDLDKLDHIVRDAVESRCIELQLDKLAQSAIKERLAETVVGLSHDAADSIAYLSSGNMRKAWKLVEYFQVQMPTKEITAQIIAEQKLGGLTPEKIDEIIDSLQNKSWQDTKSLLNSIMQDEQRAVDYFLREIVDRDLSEKGIELVSALSVWLQCDYKSPILGIFTQYQGRILLAKDVIVVPRVSPGSKPASEIMLIEPEDTPKTISLKDIRPVGMSIKDQLSNITGKTVKVDDKYPFLRFRKWSEFLNYYADNN